MKEKVLLLWALSKCLVQLAHGTDWHCGQLVLENGQELYGEVSYNLEHEVVRLRQGHQIRAYGASQVQYFEFLYRQFNVRRTFYALSYALQSGYQTPLFFELLVDGAYALLTRERIMERHQVVDQH